MSIAFLSLSIIFSPIKIGSFFYSLYYIPSLVILLYVFAGSEGYLSKLLQKQFFVSLGELSFAFFLFHVLVMRYILLYFQYLYRLGPFLLSIIAFIITMIISYLYHKSLETRINQVFLAIFQKFNLITISA